MAHVTDSIASSHPRADTSYAAKSSYGFTKNQRLLTAEQYSRVFNSAPIRASHPSFLILTRFNDTHCARLGLVIPKKQAKRAVCRNRIKRIARESFRTQQHNLPAIDAIVLARRGADTLSPEELRSIFNGLWKRIIKRAASHVEP